MKFTPTQRKRLSELLAKPHDSLENLLGEVETLVSDMLVERDRWAIVAWHPTLSVMQIVGVYVTENQARKDAVNRIVESGGTQVRIGKVTDPASIDTGLGQQRLA